MSVRSLSRIPETNRILYIHYMSIKKKNHADILTCPEKAIMDLTGITPDVFIKHPLSDWHCFKLPRWRETGPFCREKLISYLGSTLQGASYLFYLWLELSSLL